MRKPAFCICEKNKDTDQLRGNREAEQRLCFRNIDSTIPLLSQSKISSLKPYSVAVQPGLNPEDRFSHNKAQMEITIYMVQRVFKNLSLVYKKPLGFTDIKINSSFSMLFKVSIHN